MRIACGYSWLRCVVTVQIYRYQFFPPCTDTNAGTDSDAGTDTGMSTNTVISTDTGMNTDTGIKACSDTGMSRTGADTDTSLLSPDTRTDKEVVSSEF